MLAWTEKIRPAELNLEDLTILKEDFLSLYTTAAWTKSLYAVFAN